MIEIQLQAAHIVLEVLSGRSLTTVLAHAKARANRLSTAEWAGVQEISYGVFRGLVGCRDRTRAAKRLAFSRRL